MRLNGRSLPQDFGRKSEGKCVYTCIERGNKENISAVKYSYKYSQKQHRNKFYASAGFACIEFVAFIDLESDIFVILLKMHHNFFV